MLGSDGVLATPSSSALLPQSASELTSLAEKTVEAELSCEMCANYEIKLQQLQVETHYALQRWHISLIPARNYLFSLF